MCNNKFLDGELKRILTMNAEEVLAEATVKGILSSQVEMLRSRLIAMQMRLQASEELQHAN